LWAPASAFFFYSFCVKLNQNQIYLYIETRKRKYKNDAHRTILIKNYENSQTFSWQEAGIIYLDFIIYITRYWFIPIPWKYVNTMMMIIIYNIYHIVGLASYYEVFFFKGAQKANILLCVRGVKPLFLPFFYDLFTWFYRSTPPPHPTSTMTSIHALLLTRMSGICHSHNMQ